MSRIDERSCIFLSIYSENYEVSNIVAVKQVEPIAIEALRKIESKFPEIRKLMEDTLCEIVVLEPTKFLFKLHSGKEDCKHTCSIVSQSDDVEYAVVSGLRKCILAVVH